MPERPKMMSRTDRYPFVKSIEKLCAILKLSPERVLRRAGLPADSMDHEGRGATAKQIFALWNAVDAEARDPDLPLSLGKFVAHGPFTPAVFAFSCSPTIEIGLTRLALFKPLVGPFELQAQRDARGLTVAISCVERNLSLPASLAAYELVYFLELARTFTAERIVPLAAAIPDYAGDRAALEAYVGVAPETAAHVHFRLSPQDAERPLVTENAEMWASFEKDLRRQLLDRQRSAPMSARVRSALMEMLPSGQSTADAVCAHLNISKRSLHRHLRNEGHTFQGILDATRSELSLHYLAKDDISVAEISYLLAFRDPNSFYRAFRGWTGMTPMEARGQRTH